MKNYLKRRMDYWELSNSLAYCWTCYLLLFRIFCNFARIHVSLLKMDSYADDSIPMEWHVFDVTCTHGLAQITHGCLHVAGRKVGRWPLGASLLLPPLRPSGDRGGSPGWAFAAFFRSLNLLHFPLFLFLFIYNTNTLMIKLGLGIWKKVKSPPISFLRTFQVLFKYFFLHVLPVFINMQACF